MFTGLFLGVGDDEDEEEKEDDDDDDDEEEDDEEEEQEDDDDEDEEEDEEDDEEEEEEEDEEGEEEETETRSLVNVESRFASIVQGMNLSNLETGERGTHTDTPKHGLTFGINTNNPQKLHSTIEKLLNIKDLKKQWAEKREKMLSSSINVTAFWTWFFENYPKSISIMKEDKMYYTNFK